MYHGGCDENNKENLLWEMGRLGSSIGDRGEGEQYHWVYFGNIKIY